MYKQFGQAANVKISLILNFTSQFIPSRNSSFSPALYL
jgi:hypothetical protein